jgi:ABC-2 type transport system permease protein
VTTIDASLGTPIKGPSALGSDPRRFWHLTWTLAVTDWKLRFFGSALGYFWSIFRPLLLFGVLYAVFSTVFDIDIVPAYAEALLLGIVLFSFFSEATKGCVSALVAKEPLVRKIEFPVAAVPLAVVLTATFNLALNLIPVVVFTLIDGGSVRWSWLEIPFLLALLAVFAAGIGMLLSALVLRELPDDWAHLMLINPFAAILQQCRHALFGPGHLSLEQAIGGWANVIEPVIVGVLLVGLGAWVFARRAPRMAEEL